ncbi:MAG TPA: TrkA C-terminal domain-containing protein, partial [Opitutales bacterium]|nr:TrkA C-terminal domain-containing protein [Opitutales bacterium]
DCFLIGETLAGANLRRRYGISVVGIQRGEQRITSPQAEEMFLSNDLLLIVGDPVDLERFKEDLNNPRIEPDVTTIN